MPKLATEHEIHVFTYLPKHIKQMNKKPKQQKQKWTMHAYNIPANCLINTCPQIIKKKQTIYIHTKKKLKNYEK